MTVDTGQFQALTAQVAELTEPVRKLAELEFAERMFFQAGYATGQDATREAMLGRAARISRDARPRGARSSHLRAVDGGSR